MKKKYLLYILIFLTLMILTACENTKQVIVPVVEKAEVPKPAPIQIVRVKWQVLSDTGNVCLSPQDGVKLNAQTKDTIRYIKDLHSRLCYLGDTKYCSEEIK